jgi:NitT/TauT family transport system permease protein/taurine transport system permease protein
VNAGRRHLPRYISNLTSIIALIVTLAAWQLITQLRFFPVFALPSPAAVVHAFVLLFSQGYAGHNVLADIWVSTVRIVIGFASAIILDPYLQFIRPVPPLAYIPLLVIWFGIGELPKILLILFGTIPVIIIGTFCGVKATPPLRLSVARTLGASEAQMFRHVILPSALPAIFAAARVGIGVAWTCLVAAELIAADAGLGWLVQYAGQALQVAIVMAGIIMIGILGYAMELVIRLAEQKLAPWVGHDDA